MTTLDRASLTYFAHQSISFLLYIHSFRKLKPAGVSVLFAAVLAFPVPLCAATDAEIVELAQALGAGSLKLAQESRFAQGFTNIAQRASRLAGEADRLMDAVLRRGNFAGVGARFNNVSKRFAELEDAYFRGVRYGSDADMSTQMAEVSNLYNSLGNGFQRSRYYQSGPELILFATPRLREEGTLLLPNN